jgi:hypothetical protein
MVEHMAGLILCRTRVAKKPFYIHDMDVKVYSLEELCYYIYNNIYLVDMDMMGPELIGFIREEIGETKLADLLNGLIGKNAVLGELVLTILRYVDYYTNEEIDRIRDILSTLGTKNVYERLKARADSFMANECYYSAIRHYASIINGKKDTSLSINFYANVCYDMGVAYARLFLFRQAAKCFQEAYSLDRTKESKKAAMAASRLAFNSQNGYKVEFLDEQSDEEYVLKRELEVLMDNAMYSDEYRYLEGLQKEKDNGNVNAYYEKLEALLDQWKKKYGQYTT